MTPEDAIALGPVPGDPGDNGFILSNPVKNISEVTGAFRQELDYLIQQGFRLSDDGTRLLR